MTAQASQALAPAVALPWPDPLLLVCARRAIGYSAPAMTCRVPARNSGRRWPTPTRIARWIDPHTMYTALRAIQLSVRRRASTAVVSAMQPSSAAGVIATSGRIDNLE